MKTASKISQELDKLAKECKARADACYKGSDEEDAWLWVRGIILDARDCVPVD